MADSELPAPQSGFLLTHFLVVSDQDRSRETYRSVSGATVVLERDPVILTLANSWLIPHVRTDWAVLVSLFADPADGMAGGAGTGGSVCVYACGAWWRPPYVPGARIRQLPPVAGRPDRP